MGRMPFSGFIALLLWVILAVASGCSREVVVAEDVQPALAMSIDDALANHERPAADHEDDLLRKPAAVLAFVGVESGDTIFEIEAGTGYYTELLSKIVGPSGTVLMQNPQSFGAFVDDELAVRLADNRLANVRRLISNFDALEADNQSVDIVTWLLGPHELYFRPPGVDTLGDVERSYAEIYRILKPGGSFVVLDHVAPTGTPESSGNDLHRIDPAIVKELARAAGFKLIDESDVLANPDDQYDIGVFDTAVRRTTDRFLLKFQKPVNQNS